MAEKIIDVNDETKCPSCHENDATAPHTCPFKEEINSDDEVCTCCENCEYNCAAMARGELI